MYCFFHKAVYRTQEMESWFSIPKGLPIFEEAQGRHPKTQPLETKRRKLLSAESSP